MSGRAGKTRSTSRMESPLVAGIPLSYKPRPSPSPAPSFSEATVSTALAVTRLLSVEPRASRGVLHDAPRLPPRTPSAPAV